MPTTSKLRCCRRAGRGAAGGHHAAVLTASTGSCKWRRCPGSPPTSRFCRYSLAPSSPPGSRRRPESTAGGQPAAILVHEQPVGYLHHHAQREDIAIPESAGVQLPTSVDTSWSCMFGHLVPCLSLLASRGSHTWRPTGRTGVNHHRRQAAAPIDGVCRACRRAGRRRAVICTLDRGCAGHPRVSLHVRAWHGASLCHA